MHAMAPCTIGTTVDHAIRFHAMPNNAAITMGAMGRHCMNRAFKAVKHMQLSVHLDPKTLVVQIAADFTYVLSSVNKEICDHFGFAFVHRTHVFHHDTPAFVCSVERFAFLSLVIILKRSPLTCTG